LGTGTGMGLETRTRTQNPGFGQVTMYVKYIGSDHVEKNFEMVFDYFIHLFI
jgi:hypothetical protein